MVSDPSTYHIHDNDECLLLITWQQKDKLLEVSQRRKRPLIRKKSWVQNSTHCRQSKCCTFRESFDEMEFKGNIENQCKKSENVSMLIGCIFLSSIR